MWAEDKRCINARRRWWARSREGEGKGETLTEVEHCVFDSSPLPHSTPIPCGFVYVRRLCCVSVINEITLFLLLLLPPGISCFCFFVVSFCFCVIFSITIHCCCCCCHVSSALRLVLLPVGMQTVASTRSSTSSLALRFICFYLSFSRFTYWAEPNRAEFAAGAANFAQISNAFCGLRLQLRTFWTLSIIVTDSEKYLLGANNATPHYFASLWHIFLHIYIAVYVCTYVCLCDK